MTDELLVLRFRDLSVGPGETITRHRRTIAQFDNCWWGWWARRQEGNPGPMLSKLDFPRRVALYDTDQSLVYSAECARAVVSPAESPSPSVDMTPSYYNARRLRAWFLLKDIEDANDRLLVGRSCIYMPIDQPSEQLIVEKLDDLRRCETTMWLLSGGEG